MPPLSRRTALLLGGIGAAGTVAAGTVAAGTVAGGTGLWLSLASPRPDPVTGQALAQPPQLSSSGGVLSARLEAASGRLQIGGRLATALGYNGASPGPTLRLRPGDLLRLRLVNTLAEPTNLHLHGLHVSPLGNSDNVFVSVQPGANFDYEYRIPAGHPPGLYWYHPHHHGMVAGQVFSGLFGAIVLEDPEPVPVSAERVLLVSDISFDGDGKVAQASQPERMAGREGEHVLVNGQANPRFSARPGDREPWRIANCCVSRYLRLRLDGQKLQLRGMDSGRFPAPAEVQEVVLAPGNRAELLVTAAAGESVLRALPYNRGGRARDGRSRNGTGHRPGPIG